MIGRGAIVMVGAALKRGLCRQIAAVVNGRRTIAIRFRGCGGMSPKRGVQLEPQACDGTARIIRQNTASRKGPRDRRVEEEAFHRRR